MGRHSGAICSACQQRILVRDGRLIDHTHEFPTLGKSVPCVGSQSKAPDGWAAPDASRPEPAVPAQPGKSASAA